MASSDGSRMVGSTTLAKAPAPAESAPRLVSAGLESALQRFNDRTLLAAGKVNLISLEAVQKRLGARWSLRQDQVYDFAARVIERGVGPRGLGMRMSQTDFLVVQPELGRLAAQAACLRYLREILNHFLGDAHLAHEGVWQVTRISGSNLDTRPADVRAGEVADRADSGAGEAALSPSSGARAAPSNGGATGGAAAMAQRQAPAPAPGPQAEAGRPAPPGAVPQGQVIDRWSPFIANDGRQLRVTATLEPVYELKGFTRIGFRMLRRVVVTRTNDELTPPEIAKLSAADLLRVDLATIARGIDRIERDTGEAQLSLIVPLSYASLASQRGRAELVQPLRETGKLVRCGVICEICDIEGVPASALVSAVSLFRPFTLMVVGSLEGPNPASFAPLKGTGLRAVSFECPRRLSDGEFSVWAAQNIPAAKRVAGSVMVYGVASERRAGELVMLGATHVSLRPVARPA